MCFPVSWCILGLFRCWNRERAAAPMRPRSRATLRSVSKSWWRPKSPLGSAFKSTWQNLTPNVVDHLFWQQRRLNDHDQLKWRKRRFGLTRLLNLTPKSAFLRTDINDAIWLKILLYLTRTNLTNLSTPLPQIWVKGEPQRGSSWVGSACWKSEKGPQSSDISRV